MSSPGCEEGVRSRSSTPFTRDDTGRAFSAESQREMSERMEPDVSVIPKNRIIVIEIGETVVIIIIDYTGSMGNDAYIIRDKWAVLWRELEMYLGSVLVCVGSVNDAHSDKYPLQVAGLARGGAGIGELLKLYRQPRSGGGGWQESYELAAHYLVNNVETREPKRSFVFFFADEGFYPQVSPTQVAQYIGGKAKETDSMEVFRQLSEKFNTYLVHRRYGDSDIDAEIVALWSAALGDEHVLRLETPNAVVDYILGVVALHSGRTLEQYDQEMKDRDQDPERRAEVCLALQNLSKILVREAASVPSDDGHKEAKQRSSPGQRL
ncbi:MAG TPA: hypothetical protein P5080_00345 [Candidatus Paceibacterota bacterium]|nr:hypothetical protein [Candidatus Pacearchaeota archaeon]HRZ50424.1 hypothetical protein [Candidatus Paceibacterota bacterium]HSA36145.1 hypothetical protein [Candidatus Paceibacterota bacterium]